MDAHFGAFLLFEEVEGNMAKNSKVFWRLILPNAAVIFPKERRDGVVHRNIQNPMQSILDRPVFANGLQKTLSIARQTGDIVRFPRYMPDFLQKTAQVRGFIQICT